ncbi:MAG: choice-of-anchor J domain-containing protein [Bacteroidales bacterium]|nr:choice-of-anchor J domain-containing protein [Bacteroidales bacterium]
MVKKLLTLFLGLTLSVSASAQLVTIDPSDVQFWTGSGSNSTVVAIGWDDPSASYTPTVVIWGVRWEGSIYLVNALDTIAAYDERFSYTMGGGGFLQTLSYNDPDEGLLLTPSMEWNCNNYGGAYGSTTLGSTHLRISESTCSNYTFTGVTNIVYASDPNAAFSCLKAQSVFVTDLTATSVTVNITDSTNLNNYTVKLYENDSLIDSVVLYSPTISYSTLTANTGYTVKVFSNCSDGTQTSSRNVSFRTPCVAVVHTDLPWTEDFQSGAGSSWSTAAAFFSNHVFCWDLINPYSASDPYINSSSSVNVSGGQCLYVSSRPVSPTILVLPPFEDTPDQLRLQFDVLSTYGHGFEAGIITDVADESTFIPIATCLPTGSSWNHFEVTFAGVTTGRIALRSNDNGPAYLDNVAVDELPSCVKPSQVIISNINNSSADITITDPNATNHYMVYVAEDSVEIFSDNYTITNLLPNTHYVVGVRTVCTDGHTNATETAFRTDCGPIAIPYHEDFSQFADVANGYGYAVTDSTLPCWGFFKARALDRLELFPPAQGSSYGYGDGGYTLRIYSNYSDSRDILMLPELDQSLNTLEMSFMTRPSETGSFGGILEVGYMTEATDTSSFVALASYGCAQFASGYDLRALTFTNAPADARIALRVVPTGGSAKSWYIDDLDVHEMPACARANGISVDNIGTDGFTLHVDDPTSVNNYRYYLASEEGVDSLDFYDTVVTVTGVVASTDFELSVVSICPDGTLTLPHTISVSTLCAPVSTVPFEENFENWTATQSQGMNRCWNRLYCNSSNNLVTNNYPYCATGAANALTGFKSLKMYSKGTSNDIKEYSVAYLPEFQTNVSDLKVRFFYRYGGTTYNINKVRIAVGISEDISDTTTFTRLATLVPTEIGWNEFEVEFDSYNGTGNRITIMQSSIGTTAITSYIDSVVVDTISSCNRPATFEVSDVTAYGANLTWTDPSDADSYIVRWSDGATADSVTVTADTTYELTGLTPSTTYTVDIRSICWGEPTNARTLTFATSCAPMPLPWSMDFDNITNINQLSSCWNRYSGIFVDSTNSATLTSTSSGWSRSTTAFDESSHVKVNLYGTSCKYWLVTPEIDLAENAELTFDYELTDYNNADAPDTGSGFDDDRFIVLATMDNGNSWMPLAKWGSDTVNRDDYYLAALTNTPSQATVSLAALTGQVVRLAFYAESTVSGTDNDLRIDNIVVAVSADTTVTPPDTTEIPEDAAIAFSDILYWVGEGSDSAVFVLNIDSTSVAWGYRFNEDDELTIGDMLVDIDAADPRLAYTISWETYEFAFFYVNHPLKLMTDYYRFKVDGILADEYEDFDDYDLADNAIVVVSNRTDDVWDTPIEPATVAVMPVDATISAEEILYWVGEGSNEAVIAINWGVPDTALAWGLRFNGDLTVTTALQTLVAADDRLTTDAAMSTFHYADSATTLSFQNETGNYMQFILNGNSQASLSSVVSDGAFLKVGESAYGVGYDSTAFAGQWYPMGVAWPTPIHPVSVPDTGTTPIDTVPIPEEATIAFSDILYWVGEGSNEAVMAVNWVDTALAWGYRWNGTATVGDMMAHIAAADPRFSYTGTGMVSDINYIDTAAGMTTPLGITPGNWWSSTNNGVMDMGMSQTLSNGDFEKWADSSTGILVDSVWMEEYGGYWNYIYVYPMTIHPVTVPDTTTIQDGIDTHEMPQVFAYPNPCNGTLYIINENAERVELYNVNGQLLEMVNSGDTHITLNMQSYPAGLYMLKVGNGVQKILKK